jgi:hypothetical protein
MEKKTEELLTFKSKICERCKLIHSMRNKIKSIDSDGEIDYNKIQIKNEYIDYILIKVCKLDDMDDKEIVLTIIDNLIKLKYY